MKIKEILMKRDGNSEGEAKERIAQAKMELDQFLTDGNMKAAEEICQMHFGLEPDYLDELL